MKIWVVLNAVQESKAQTETACTCPCSLCQGDEEAQLPGLKQMGKLSGK